MIEIIQGHARLVLIYLITVALTGGLLIFLGINSIGNYKELTEKRINEEQEDIAEQYLLVFDILMDSAGKLAPGAGPDPITKTGYPTHAFFPSVELFMFDSAGRVIDPPYARAGFRTGAGSKRAFITTFRSGEREEFAAGRPDRAADLYGASLNQATDLHDSARAYTALARAFLKQGMGNKAKEQYRMIISDLGGAVNDDGLPYAYLAMRQLLKSDYGPDKSITLLFLEHILRKKIPYSSVTADLVEALREKRQLEAHIADSLCKLIEQKSWLIREYSDRLEYHFAGHTQPGNTDRAFDLIRGNDDDDIMFLYADGSLFRGAVVRYEEMHQYVLNSLAPGKPRFEHDVLLSRSNTDDRMNRPFTERFRFPLSDGSTDVVIRIKEPGKVHRYVFIREMVTGVGLLLIILVSVFGFYLLLADIKRKRRLDLLRADFVANVTHELKTPLTSIHMFADSILMGKAKTPDKLEKYARVILKESEKLKRMVSNILEFSKKENEGLHFALQKYRLDEILEDALHENGYWLDINKFTVHKVISPGISAMTDPEGLKQVISNLISNAIKYSADTREVTIRLFEKNGKAVIEVEDKGIGIPASEQELIFRKFYRVYASEGERASGTGLGLTVSKDIIEAMGGELKVESKLNTGSTFSIIMNKIKDHG